MNETVNKTQVQQLLQQLQKLWTGWHIAIKGNALLTLVFQLVKFHVEQVSYFPWDYNDLFIKMELLCLMH